MAAFEKSKEGRVYRSQSAAFSKRTRLTKLKGLYMTGEPKRGQSAYFLWIGANRSKVAAENPELKGIGPIGTKCGQVWKALSVEERQPWLDKEKEESAAYIQRLEAFHATEDYK